MYELYPLYLILGGILLLVSAAMVILTRGAAPFVLALGAGIMLLTVGLTYAGVLNGPPQLASLATGVVLSVVPALTALLVSSLVIPRKWLTRWASHGCGLRAASVASSGPASSGPRSREHC